MQPNVIYMQENWTVKALIAKLVVVLVVAIVGYNYFFGTAEEKESAKAIVGQVKSLTSSVATLLKSEKEKFDQGKYDEAMSKIKTALHSIHDKAVAMGDSGEKLLNKVESLEQQEDALEHRLHELGPEDSQRAMAIRDEILRLNTETEYLTQTLAGY